jgi:alkyl hydroperoxide reductase subunit AhpF
MQQPSSQDQATLIYRVETLERLFRDLQQQLQQYVRSSENELHLRNISDTVARIERELSLAKTELTSLSNKISDSELEAQRRDAAQNKRQDELQIKVLWGAISVIITIVSLVLVNYATHWFK